MIDHFTYIGDTTEPDAAIRENVLIHFMALEGIELDYYGADSADHTFNIDGIVFKVLENPDDGYRSYLGAIDYSDTHSSLFFKRSVAKVKIIEFNEDPSDLDSSSRLAKGYRLVDVTDDHVWLQFGTGNYDDYYPYFMFSHYPKEQSCTSDPR